MSPRKAATPLTDPVVDENFCPVSFRTIVAGDGSDLVSLGAGRSLATATSGDDRYCPLRPALRFSAASSPCVDPSFSTEIGRGSAPLDGLVGNANTAARQLYVEHGGRSETAIGLRALQGLPRVDLATERSGVEGWSDAMHFSGVRFLDFVTKFGLATRSGRAPDLQGDPKDLYRYVYLVTPGKRFQVGLDISCALHRQTLLCDMSNGEPLTPEQGGPLRLHLTVQHGYRSLQRVVVIRFSDRRPPNEWAEAGYDWYAGL
jgi:hypothetical protein